MFIAHLHFYIRWSYQKLHTLLKNEQATLCLMYSKYHLFIVFQHSVKDEERIFMVLLLNFQHRRVSEKMLFPNYLESENCYFQTILPNGFAHLLGYDKETATSRQNRCLSTNTLAKTSLCVYCQRLLMMLLKLYYTNKFNKMCSDCGTWE